MRRWVILLGMLALMGPHSLRGQKRFTVAAAVGAGSNNASADLEVGSVVLEGLHPWLGMSAFDYYWDCDTTLAFYASCSRPGGPKVGAGVDLDGHWMRTGGSVGYLWGDATGAWWSIRAGIRFGEHRLVPLADLVFFDPPDLDVLTSLRVGLEFGF